MRFLIADTFTASLARLANDAQKAVKTTAFDLQLNPANPGFSFHKLDRARDKHFWSVRVGRDIRLIVHRTDESLLLCYVDHHDKAYEWAEKRRLETHPNTGAAQIVEIRERVEEIRISPPAVSHRKKLFDAWPDAELLGFGVPEEWLADVRAAEDDDTLLDLAGHLPQEAAETLLELATGNQPPSIPSPVSYADPFQHPDAQRRFHLVSDADELRAALDYPWEKWTLFLHPAQRQAVERDYNGPVRISGSAGTGKTIVALHRAYQRLRQKEEATVLLATFSTPLANALKNKLHCLLRGNHLPRLAERVTIAALDDVVLRLYRYRIGNPVLLNDETLHEVMQEASQWVPDHGFPLPFLLSEWRDVIDAWQLDHWEAYRDIKRLGRKTRLSETQRQTLWRIFEFVGARLDTLGVVSMAGILTRLAGYFATQDTAPYDYIVVDEAQDLSVPQMRFLAALGHHRADALFFTGDLGQRIFQTAFSWKALGVDIRGRSRTLTVNYRTSHQIRALADRLLNPEISDMDGNAERRLHTVSVFSGVEPLMRREKTQEAEIAAAADWLKTQIAAGIRPGEIGVFVRSEREIERATQALAAAGIPCATLDEQVLLPADAASVGVMHLAKGLEFRAVAVMACDEGVLPSSARLADVAEESDLHEVQETERHLFYVACTRARDALFISSGGRHSEFLDDLVAESRMET
ncbi:MAG: UvrD-helicase domain-containing protein [Zoogloeaceae bacterium]|jgi:superfamily I DNA/RNA helicase/mRNA-degrading endonuclease RelE of RelBE toxin-antitoxin system|nr:UvrD-helicase domain-containing protein [Zoogloeaceae bacterium]